MRPVRDVALGAESAACSDQAFESARDMLRVRPLQPDRLSRAMVNFPGRNGRRRRVLNEEVLSASSSHARAARLSTQDELARRRRGTATRPASKTIRRSPTSCRGAIARSRCWC